MRDQEWQRQQVIKEIRDAFLEKEDGLVDCMLRANPDISWEEIVQAVADYHCVRLGISP